MPDIMMRLGREVLVLDGAMGTMLQRAGLPAGESPELLNITAPDMVGQVMRLYQLAGSDCAITNTFGGSRPKLAEYGYADRVEEFNRAAVRIAKRYGAPHVLADIGPTGLLMQPLGPATFDELFEIFAEQAAALAAEAPDAIFLETFTDISEVRCAVLAIRSVTDLPVFASCTFGISGRMDLSGTTPEAAAVILEAAGASAVGLNCGLGPDQMLPLLERMVSATTLPVIAQPNAGMPYLDDSGKTVFPGTPDEMGAFAEKAAALGAAAVGSCCGSTPAYTGAIVDAVADRDVVVSAMRGFDGTVVAGPRGVVVLGAGEPVRVIGERINPTGKPQLKESLLAGSMSVVRTFAAEQTSAGADMLDVNVGAAGVDASAVLPQAILALVGTAEPPLVVDTTDVKALEEALRLYPGRALINSVNGDPASMESVLPLAARYGAAVVVLALDETGIPATVEGRLGVVEKVRERAHHYGLTDRDLVVDTLVMTAATDAMAPRVTVDSLAAVHELGLATLLGVSNVSHGLPNRPMLNAAFVDVAAQAGLAAAIVNPNDSVVMDAIRLASARRAQGDDVTPREQLWSVWDEAYALALDKAAKGTEALAAEEARAAEHDPVEALSAAVLRGDMEAAPALADAVIDAGMPAENVIGSVLTPAIQKLGDAFGRGEVFLPQMMVSAEAMKAAVARVKSRMPESAAADEGRVVFATVKGDIHSIGKDICVSLLESQGFAVDDLGVDVAADAVLAATGDSGADAVCLSALMTTTLPAMEAMVSAVKSSFPQVAVFVGGAVVTAEWAESIGAGYSADAPGCVEAVRLAIGR